VVEGDERGEVHRPDGAEVVVVERPRLLIDMPVEIRDVLGFLGVPIGK
jgi:hypothetical protein